MKYIVLLSALLVLSACDMHKQFHTAYLTEEEVVFENVEILRNGRSSYYDGFINKLSKDGTLLIRYKKTSDKKNNLFFAKSTDQGESWQQLTSFEKYKVIQFEKCGTEKPDCFFWLDKRNVLIYLGENPAISIDIENFNKTGDYKFIDRGGSFGEDIMQKIYVSGDTVISTNGLVNAISSDKGKSWEWLEPHDIYYTKYGMPIRSLLIANTITSVYSYKQCFSTDFGKTWQVSESISKFVKDSIGEKLYRFWDLSQLSSGEYHIGLYYIEKSSNKNDSKIVYVYFNSTDGIHWSNFTDEFARVDSTYKYERTPFLIDKLGKNKYIAWVDDEKYPVQLITKHHTYKLPFPTGNIEYTKSGYWYYYDNKKHNFCRRKIVLK